MTRQEFYKYWNTFETAVEKYYDKPTAKNRDTMLLARVKLNDASIEQTQAALSAANKS